MNAESIKTSDEQFIEDCVTATIALELKEVPQLRTSLWSRFSSWLSRVIGGSK